MTGRRAEGESAHGIMTNADAVAILAEEILREEAWWMAVRAGKHCYARTVWADGAPASVRPPIKAAPSSSRLKPSDCAG